MKKRTAICIAVLFSGTAFSQVGINTTKPQQIFHIDGIKNNPVTGAPTVPQQADDFVVTAEGRIGAGMIDPTQKLDVDGKVRIRNTEFLTGTHVPLYVDENGVVGRSNALESEIAFFTSNAPVNYGIAGANNGDEQIVPVNASDSSLNNIAVSVPSVGQVRIGVGGVYMISASVSPRLNFADDGDGYAYIAFNIDVSADGGTTWQSVSGGRPVFPRLGAGLTRAYSYTVPTIIRTLNVNDLIRLKFYRTKQGSGTTAVLQGSSFNSVALGSSYGAPTYTLSITRL
ncbi:hypothetical protein [Chryseobacterium phocaeense]|uniref:hypothetical protein n=1 Tax=Chryseobacterium phocaeense TaxID=1816690 RepID=UPI0009BAD629|nr:hypothetical protein [Chryseobacterium phocaeense]